MSNLTIFEKQLPLRAYPETDLNMLLDTQFKFWLANLLSLKADKEDAFEVAKDAIKKHCIGMGFPEIKKMFMMYADNELSITPVPNYFDRILLGKIVTEYKSRRKPKKTKIEMGKVDVNMEQVIIDSYLEFQRTKKLPVIINHIYQYLFDNGKLPQHNNDFKMSVLDRAKVQAKTEAMERAQEDYSAHKALGTAINKINDGKGLKTTCMRIILTDYFNKQKDG